MAKGKEAAEMRYVAIARGLGWNPSVPSIENKADSRRTNGNEEPSAEELLERDSVDEERKSGTGGLGNAVSTMDKEDDEVETSLHGLAIQGNTDRLSAFLDQNPSCEINSLDEYVSSCQSSFENSAYGSCMQGYTPLLLACDRGHKSVVELLLERGADTSIKASPVSHEAVLENGSLDTKIGRRRTQCS